MQVLCTLLVAAAWEYPERFIATSRNGFSTDRRARVELVAKNWSGGMAWLFAMQMVDTAEFTTAELQRGPNGAQWHPWASKAPGSGGDCPPLPTRCFSRGTSLSILTMWLIAVALFGLTGAALVAFDRYDRRKRQRAQDADAAALVLAAAERLPTQENHPARTPPHTHDHSLPNARVYSQTDLK